MTELLTSDTSPVEFVYADYPFIESTVERVYILIKNIMPNLSAFNIPGYTYENLNYQIIIIVRAECKL